jgi:hypothetical protein
MMLRDYTFIGINRESPNTMRKKHMSKTVTGEEESFVGTSQVWARLI